jgi:TonB family protein
MTKFGTTVVFVAALALLVPLAGLESQEPEGPSVADLSDPAFQALAQSGPATEDDLRLIIEAYVANEATESARQVLVDWITRESGTTLGHSPCGLCTEKLTAMGRPWRDEMQRLILDAFDDVQQRAYDQNDGELLVRLAKIAVDSKNNDVITLGAYYLSEGLRVGGGDATASELAISYLYELGELEQARNLAERLQNDPTSPLFQSESASRWIQYINNTLARRNRLASIVLGGGAVVASDSDYLPLIKEAPRYPASAAAAGIEGHAIVEYSVNERGRPEDARVVESSDPAFDEPSLASVELYRYMPRIVGGTPVDVPGVRTVIRYRLQK